MRSVIAYGRGLHEHLRAISGLLDRGRHVFGAVDPAIPDLSFHLVIPPLGKQVVPGKVDNGVAAVDLCLPAALGRWVALNHLEFAELGLAPDRVGVAGKDHRLMTLRRQLGNQVATNQPGAPRDENPHDHPLLRSDKRPIWTTSFQHQQAAARFRLPIF